MLSVIYAKCRKQTHYTEYYYAECRNAECHHAECRNAECHFAECRNAECHHDECRNAEYLYAPLPLPK
jgi:hypothetical protein